MAIQIVDLSINSMMIYHGFTIWYLYDSTLLNISINRRHVNGEHPSRLGKVHGVAQAFTHPIHLATDRDGWGPDGAGRKVIWSWENGKMVGFLSWIPLKVKDENLGTLF